jgi:hypothetical protein
MRRLARICILTIVCGSVVFGQAAAVPARWIGTWALSPPESELGQDWGPNATIIGGTLEIAASSGRMKITGDAVTSERGSSQEEFDLNLDGSETVFLAGPRLSFKRIDDMTFDVIASVNNKKFGNHVGENHFVFSADGNMLTETKTHTEREVVPEGGDQTKGAVIRTSTSVLVFYKLLFIPPGGLVFLRYIRDQP